MNQKPVKIDIDQHDQLKAIQERDGVPIAESVRRALDAYLQPKKPSTPPVQSITEENKHPKC